MHIAAFACAQQVDVHVQLDYSLCEAKPFIYCMEQASEDTTLLNVKFCLLDGPSLPLKIKPKIISHGFNNRSNNCPEQVLDVCYRTAVTTLSLAYPITMRVMMALDNEA